MRPDTTQVTARTSRVVDAAPYPLGVDPTKTALVVIDMQRAFLEPGGFGEMLGNDVSLLRSTIAPTKAVLTAARAAGITIIHTREGHRPDLMAAPPSKLARGNLALERARVRGSACCVRTRRCRISGSPESRTAATA